MASTLLLDLTTHDLVLDANGNIAVAGEPYALAQDAASAIMTNLGECYWDVTVGIPWSTLINGPAAPSIAQLRAALVQAAETVPDVAAAAVFFSSVKDRLVQGQVQVISSSGQQSSASFSAPAPVGPGFAAIDPQGV
jgi:hypothetical protein